MPYRSDTIATVIGRLNSTHFLPAIQREFVWQPQQIIQLFDSIMRGYPISSFLFWDLKSENRDKWQIYKFVERFKQGGTHNELASTEGVQQVTLVLDGQQRLTSLLIALKGTYTIKRKYRRYDDPAAWIPQALYLDLLQDPRAEAEESDVGVRYGFQFFQKPPKNDDESHWLKVGRILDFDSQDHFDEFRDLEEGKLADSVTKGQLQVFRRNFERLYRAIWREEAISYYTETDQDYDRVLDIFVRANEGGTKLSKSDLLLSMVTSKWSGSNARDEIFAFVDRLNFELNHKNDFDKDFVMKSCLVLSDLEVKYKVQNFNNQNLTTIEKNWSQIKSAVEKAVRLVNEFGVDRDNLTSVNAIVPVAYYFMRCPGRTLLGSSAFDVATASAVRIWLLSALLNNTFGRSSDTVLTEIRKVLREHLEDTDEFPSAGSRLLFLSRMSLR